jgi:hypothetical protein
MLSPAFLFGNFVIRVFCISKGGDMNLFENLFGGQQRQKSEDFVNRYQQGHPAEGYSGEEVMQRYQTVTGNIPEDVYEQSAEESFARLSPQERKEFFQFLRQRAQQQQGAQDFPDLNQDGLDDRYQDPHELAQLTTHMRRQQPGFLEQLFGGGGQGMLGNPLAKGALAGIVAMAMRKMMQ